MQLRWDMMHRSMDGTCVLAIAVGEEEGEEEQRFLLEVAVEEDGLSFAPMGELAEMFELYQDAESPDALAPDDARRWHVARVVDAFVGRLAESGLLDLVDEEEDELDEED